jgi:hypothetical protein
MSTSLVLLQWQSILAFILDVDMSVLHHLQRLAADTIRQVHSS